MKLNKPSVSYGDIALAAMGIVFYGAKNRERMMRISALSQIAVLIFSCICMILFRLFPDRIVSIFIDDASTVSQGADILKGNTRSVTSTISKTQEPCRHPRQP